MAVKIDLGKCTGCDKCVEVCPVNAIRIESEKAIVSDECVECGLCVNECPNEAISLDR